MLRRRPLIAVLTALLFLAVQQGAFGHLIGHLGAAGSPSVVAVEADQGATAGLSDVCTLCVALSAITGGAPPPSPVAGPVAVEPGSQPLPPALPVLAALAASPYRARAPPAVL